MSTYKYIVEIVRISSNHELEDIPNKYGKNGYKLVNKDIRTSLFRPISFLLIFEKTN